MELCYEYSMFNVVSKNYILYSKCWFWVGLSDFVLKIINFWFSVIYMII